MFAFCSILYDDSERVNLNYCIKASIMFLVMLCPKIRIA